MIKCLFCGKCCYYLENGILTKCKFLVKRKNGKTLCRVYSTRLGRPIGVNHHCDLRVNSEFDYEGCPYNTDKGVLF